MPPEAAYPYPETAVLLPTEVPAPTCVEPLNTPIFITSWLEQLAYKHTLINTWLLDDAGVIATDNPVIDAIVEEFTVVVVVNCPCCVLN